MMDGHNEQICYNEVRNQLQNNIKKIEEARQMLMYWEAFKGLLKNEKGQGMVEYGLILSLIAVVVIAALTLMGGNLTSMFNSTAGSIK